VTTPRNYARVYYEIVEHPRFERVYRNPSALGTWLQMLLTADAMHPMNPPMPPRTPTVRLLIDTGLVIEKTGNRYSIRGLEAERERRSAVGRNAALVRHGSERNANALLEENSKEEKKTSNGANAPGAPAAIRPSFIAFPPKKPERLTEAEIESFRRTIASSRDPLIADNARQTLERHGIPVEVSS
jgi:hypothetical protein